jgi:Na+/H+-dicarboxylate symporter
MNLALQRRRLFIAMTITVVALVVAMAAVVATFGFHQAWGMWLFAGAILAGFASHGWLMLGVLREKSPS